MMYNKSEIEPHSQRSINLGDYSVWFDDWLEVRLIAIHNDYFPRLKIYHCLKIFC